MTTEVQTPPQPEQATKDTDTPGNGLLRAVELGLRQVLGQLGRSGGPILSGIAEPLSRTESLADLRDVLARFPGVVSLLEEIDVSEVVRRAKSGSAVFAPCEDGWLCVCGGGAWGPRAFLTGRGRERQVAVRKLAQYLGKDPRSVVVVEPGLALGALSFGATGSTHPATRLWALLRLEARDLIALIAFSITLGGMSLAVPVAVQVLVNTIALGSLFQPLVVLSILLFAVLGFAGLVRVISWYTVEVLQRRIFVRVAEDFARRVPLLRASVHDRYDAPELVNRFFEVVNLQKALGNLLIDVLGLILQGVVGMALLAFYHPVFLAFDLALIVALGCVALLGFGAVGTAVNESKAKYAVASWLESLAAQPLMLTSERANVSGSLRADMLTRQYISARQLHYKHVFRQIVGGVGVQVLAMVAVLGIGGTLVMQGELTLGQLVAAELVVGVLASGFTKLGKYLETGFDLLASLDKVGKIVDLDLGELPSVSAVPQNGLAIQLNGVVSRSAEGPVSGEISATLRQRGRYLLAGVGTTDAAALMEVLAGHRAPLRGNLRTGETPTDAAGYLRNASVLVRTAQVLPVSILENLRFGDPLLDEAQAFEALRRLGLADRVAALPKGLHTVLLASGAPLSRAEVTRLSLARAWVAKPPLLLVDGAFDELGLDLKAQEEVLALFLGPEAPWTVVAATDDPRVSQHLSETLELGASAKGEQL